MKKLIQVLCSLFFATTMTIPVDAIANSFEDHPDVLEEMTDDPSAAGGFHLSLVTGDFGLPLGKDKASHSGSPLIFVSDSTGKIVQDAQVITTVIGPAGSQLMNRACPFRSGYLVFTNHLLPGRCRIEAEVVIDGMLLTKEFYFVNA